MRLSRTNISNAATGFLQEGEPDPEQVAEEARRAEQIAARRAFLEEKIRNAREAKQRAEEQRRKEELRLAEEARFRIAAAPKPVVEALQTSTAAGGPIMPVTPHGISAEELASPGWQNAFLMGPNVRFTRTRETEIISRRPPVEPAPVLSPVAVNQAAMRVVEPPAIESHVSIDSSQMEQAAEFQLPPWEDMPFAAETYKPFAIQKSPAMEPDALEMTVIATAFHKAPAIALDASPSLPKTAESVAAPVVESRLVNLSDFAFWDAMPFESEFLAAVRGTPVQPAVVPEIQSRVESIIAKFRVVECRRPSSAMASSPDAGVSPVIAAAASAELAPVVETAPVGAFVMDELAALEALALAPVAPARIEAAAPTIAESMSTEPTTFVPPAFVTAVFASAPETVVEVKPAPAASVLSPAPVMVVAPMPVRTSAPAAAAPAPVVEAKPVIPAVEAAKQRLIDPPPSQITPRRANALALPEWRPIAPSGEGEYELPPRELLQEPVARTGVIMTQETLEQNAGLLESVLEDFGVKGEIIHVRPGPVVTLYEFEPAPGVKSSRVINLADDIARSMSALSARVAVVPGRNVIGIELPNVTRETVYFREMIDSADFEKSGYKLALGLGKTIGGEPVIAELAKMPHLLVAGTTGSGKSVAINTMILSLLYRMTPEQCRLIMVDPKMLELSVYDGIPHLLTPVVTDPKKAVMALKWAVREMEDRYKKMSRLGVRNIDGYNSRVASAKEKGETIHVMVQTGFDKGTGAPIEEQQEMDLTPMPYIVVIVDEMADLMMVAGKEIEGAIQRLAQMARAAGIHLIMATQRPSVDVITGTIKANFPTRISFQVTSKIDSRTILGEQGAEQLLGQGDMLHMAGGGRISRVHGPFVSDEEVEKVVAHLKLQGRPEYLDTVTADEDEEDEDEDTAVFDKGAIASEDGDDLYEQAIKVVMRDKKCSTSYIQRRLGIGYNRAASLVERMEKDGLVGPANHVGKREIISGNRNGGGNVGQEDFD
ncbi:DNA translocase FtsK [Rhizobium leucaenae]|uniref:S-DNA-T family DNA segregation ATPase FtsK/SpoIIIE n=1 Tax=Rhizobium leucaenae TaxID=29450 RepID=A0A7W6ZUL5_9HYPH|nr:DNA translocase FtsK [Rhizobium leucaenae]MBB4568510.1 S-DNA-T family DNA segregation ATPase FtsK/SpoIIIE [Rhizobium leucaenae]MBB6300330.1 S-DNA-T family DNA segregation ATPase FtsK/SpoIIIE [Rhizobium leucaenae]